MKSVNDAIYFIHVSEVTEILQTEECDNYFFIIVCIKYKQH